MVLLLGVLVAGLLRSHADIVRALHSLGAGIGDHPLASANASAGTPSAPVRFSPSELAVPLSRGASSGSAFDLSGATPLGDGVAVAVTGVSHVTLLAFLSSGCASCGGFWTAFEDGGFDLPASVRPVVVTKGLEFESPGQIPAARCPYPVVMSTEAWRDYEVPGSPFFVLVDGPTGRRLGAGSAPSAAQVASMVRQAMSDLEAAGAGGPDPRPVRRTSGVAFDLADRRREAGNDAELLAAGIPPGHESLFRRRIHRDRPSGAE